MRVGTWTDWDIERLGVLAADGFTATEAGRVLGRSSAGVSSKASEKGIALRGPSVSSTRKLLAAGVPVVRDDLGVHGVRWALATRSGEPLHSHYVERLFALGMLRRMNHGHDVYVAAWG